MKYRWAKSAFTQHAIAVLGAIGLLAIAPLAAQAQDGPKVQISGGPIQGFFTRDVAEFLGIPYAAPPVGDLRWRPPQAPAKWAETLLTINFGNTCVQKAPPP